MMKARIITVLFFVMTVVLAVAPVTHAAIGRF
jgi:hypothetical protein